VPAVHGGVGAPLRPRARGARRPDVEKMDRQLRLFGDTLEEWLEVQRQWMYLESIFSTPDIIRQLPAESRAFAAVDRQFRDMMRRTKDRPNALQVRAGGVLLRGWCAAAWVVCFCVGDVLLRGHVGQEAVDRCSWG
jgi:hypothetical protein